MAVKRLMKTFQEVIPSSKLQVAAFYCFTPMKEEVIDLLLNELTNNASEGEVKGTVLLATEGINGTVCGPMEGVTSLLEQLQASLLEKTLEVKFSWTTVQAFRRFKARKKWFGAQLLIVNHHLFFANVANSGAVLPAFDAVVFDEAQNLEEAATQFLGLEISNSNLFYFLDRLHNPRTKKGLLTRLDHALVPHVRKLAMTVRQAIESFFTHLLEEYGREDRVLRFYKPPVLDNGIYVPLEALRDRKSVV